MVATILPDKMRSMQRFEFQSAEIMITTQDDFTRFDYFARWVQRLQIGLRSHDDYWIMRVLVHSRPKVPTFPGLKHLEVLGTSYVFGHLRLYVFHTLQTSCFTGFDAEEIGLDRNQVCPTSPMLVSLIKGCGLSALHSLIVRNTSYGLAFTSTV